MDAGADCFWPAERWLRIPKKKRPAGRGQVAIGGKRKVEAAGEMCSRQERGQSMIIVTQPEVTSSILISEHPPVWAECRGNTSDVFQVFDRLRRLCGGKDVAGPICRRRDHFRSIRREACPVYPTNVSDKSPHDVAGVGIDQSRKPILASRDKITSVGRIFDFVKSLLRNRPPSQFLIAGNVVFSQLTKSNAADYCLFVGSHGEAPGVGSHVDFLDRLFLAQLPKPYRTIGPHGRQTSSIGEETNVIHAKTVPLHRALLAEVPRVPNPNRAVVAARGNGQAIWGDV